MYPEQNVSAWIVSGRGGQGCSAAVGYSILNRTATMDVGSLMLKYGGGGHRKVGTCQFKDDEMYKTEYSNNTNETTASSKAEIKITGSGNYTGSITVNFTISKNLVDISKAVISKISDQLYNFGQPLTPDVTVTFGGKTLVYGEDYALVYVDNIDEGVATVTVRGINSNTGSLSAKFNINPVDISDGQIALDASEYMYTGTAVKPVINSFTVKRAGKTVTVTDFDNLEISYSSNTNVGTGKVTIKALEGEGFTGSVSKTFAIVGASVDNASVKVGNGVYTGEAVTPDHTVTLGGRTLVEGRDYRADYSNNVNVTDSAVLTITGMGNYSGSTTARFKISARNLADADITVASARYTYGKYHLNSRYSLLFMYSNRNSSSIIHYGDGVILIYIHLNVGTISCQSLIYRIINYLVYKMVKSSGGCTSYVHTRSLSDCFQSLQNLYLFSSIIIIFHCHASSVLTLVAVPSTTL